MGFSLGWQGCSSGNPLKQPCQPLENPVIPSSFTLEDTGKKKLIMLLWPIFGNFWCPVVTLVIFSSNLNNFEKNHKKKCKKNLTFNKIQKIQKSKKKI